MTDFLFADEQIDNIAKASNDESWNILVVDDEEDIHQVTKLVLNGFTFEDKRLIFHHAYTAAEAMQMLKGLPEVAVALVDVVMETSHAGLDLIRYIREDADNHDIRLILRTGQPGEAPEESVIRDYDINDYKNKTELTAIKLKTLLYSALRSYRDICIIEQHKLGLENIINASAKFLECETVNEFASSILEHVSGVIGHSNKEIYCAAAINSIMLFETLVEGDFNRQKMKKPGRPIARRLSVQHRMHPTIADIVSRCFYAGALPHLCCGMGRC